MHTLIRLYGWPHEALHVLALLLIGRRPRAFTGTHVDIPDDLTAGQFSFVAGLPGLVFALVAALGLLGLLQAATAGQALAGLAAATLGTLGAAGCAGDLQLILLRWRRDDGP